MVVYGTVYFVKALLDKYFSLHAALKRIEADQARVDSDQAGYQDSEVGDVRQQNMDISGVDLFNTEVFATEGQHKPLLDWFHAKNIQFDIDVKAVDTTGFYDEVAYAIGENYSLFKQVVDQIRFAQSKNIPFVNLKMSVFSQKDAQTMVGFCRQLYDYSMVARYWYQKPEKIVRLTLQQSSLIQGFFSGAWLEWYCLVVGLKLAQESGIRLACARNVKITFQNQDLHELDVFFLINGKIPVCVECKSGEFRQSIDKYVALRKRLDLDAKQFVVCVAGLNTEQANGLSSMYGLAFTNIEGLPGVLGQLITSSVEK